MKDHITQRSLINDERKRTHNILTSAGLMGLDEGALEGVTVGPCVGVGGGVGGGVG